MTCVYEDHKLFECPGLDSSTNSSTQAIDSQSSTLHSLTTESDSRSSEETATNSSIQTMGTNKMSSWNDIINRSNKLANNPIQLNNNDIMESLNQITTTSSSIKLNDEFSLNSSENASNNSSAQESAVSPAQFGTRFNAASSNTETSSTAGKTRISSALKKVASSPSYEDLFTKYQKRKKYKVATTTASSSSLETTESGNLSANGQTESAENTATFYTTQASSQANGNGTTNDKAMMYQSTEQSTSDQLFSTQSNLNDQSSNDNNHLNHHADYKEINDQSYQFASYQTSSGEDSVQAIKIGQMIGNHRNSTFNNQFNNQFDKSTSTDSGFKPIFMQTLHQSPSRPSMNQFKFVNSKLSIIGGKDQLDSIDSTISTASTTNPALFTDSSNGTLIVSELNQPSINHSQQTKLNQTTVTLSNEPIKHESGYQTRENYRLKVKDVSDQKLKDFIKNNDLIDLSSTAISTNTATNPPIQIVPQILKEKRSRIKSENLKASNYGKQQNLTTRMPFTGNQYSLANWPTNTFQFKTDKPQFQPQSLNYWPYLNSQNLNKQYNSYTLDNLINDESYKYDYVFGLSKLLPSINSNLPPFLPDKSFMMKYPSLFSDYYSPTDLQALNANANKVYVPKKVGTPSNQQEKNDQQIASASASLPGWLKSKFSLKSPISRNTNYNPNAAFSNTNNFLHSAASSSFNYPLYELPPPSLLKQQRPSHQQSSIALPLISPTASSASNSQEQLNNFLNSQLVNPNLLLNGQLIPTTNTPQTQQQPNSNTRKTFFSQLSRLFSSASIARPVRVPAYSTANLASAFSTLTQPFSKLQIDNLSNQLFSPFKGFLNATTAYIPIRKENPTASSYKNGHNDANSDEDELDELEKQILSANGISPYALSSQSTINQPNAQPTSNVGQQHTQNAPLPPNTLNALNFNAYNLHHPNHQMPLGQTLYGPIKRSSLQQQLASSFKPTKLLYTNANLPQVRSVMMSNKPTNQIQQPSTNNQFPKFLASKHDLMDAYILENDDFADDYGFKKRSRKRRKRSIAYTAAAAPMHAIHYAQPPPPKYTFPFLAPYISSPIISSPILPAATAYVHGPSAYFPPHHHPHAQPIPITNYATPVLPAIMPMQYANGKSTVPKLLAGESQFRPQIVSHSLQPTSTQSASQTSSSSSSQTNSKSTVSTASTLNSSSNTPSFGSLSLASAASQLAVSLANISKNHKNTKIRKHLSKLASSSTFLPSIGNLTSSFNGLDNSIANGNNRTMPKENAATATVWQKPPGQSTFTTWSFSTIPTGSKEYALSFTDFPFFPNQFTNTLRNLPAASTAYFVTDARPPPANLHHPFNGQYNSIDLNSLTYSLPGSNNYAFAQLPKLHIQYRPANTVSTKTR